MFNKLINGSKKEVLVFSNSITILRLLLLGRQKIYFSSTVYIVPFNHSLFTVSTVIQSSIRVQISVLKDN